MFILTVVCNQAEFDAYWYGTGRVISSELVREGFDGRTFVVDYGDDGYRCQYQADRFSSGLFFAKVEQKTDTLT